MCIRDRHLTAVADKAKKAEIVDKVQPQLADVAAGDGDIEDFSSALGDSLIERTRLDAEKKDEMAQAVVETLSQSVGRTPLHHQAVKFKLDMMLQIAEQL